MVYLLDGDAHFVSVTNMIPVEFYKRQYKVPKRVVVAIINTNRMRDLAPTHVKEHNQPNTSGSG